MRKFRAEKFKMTYTIWAFPAPFFAGFPHSQDINIMSENLIFFSSFLAYFYSYPVWLFHYLPLISISLTLPQQIDRISFPSSIFINLIQILFHVQVTTKGQQTFKFSTASSIRRSFNRFPVLKFQAIISPWLPQFDPDINFSLWWSRHLNPYPVVKVFVICIHPVSWKKDIF